MPATKVLIADDDAASRQMLEATLHNSGFESISVVNGLDAWSRLRSPDAPRLVVADWIMPVMDGLELCRRIREKQKTYYIYVILVSGRNYKVDHFAAMEAGVDDYITKPWKPEELVGKLKIGQRVLAHEEKLSRLIGDWRTMVDSAPFGMACLAADGTIVRANTAFFDLLGGERSRVLGENIGRTLLPKTPDSKGLLDCIRFQEKFDDVRLEVSRLDRSTKQVKIWGRPVQDMPGVAYEIVTSVSE